MADLLGLCEEIVGRAASGEEIEAYAARGSTTSVRVRDGEIESVTQAASAGIGVRVVSEGRQGFAYAGALDPEVLDEVLSDARDNARFAAPDEANGLAAPDGVEPPELDLFRPGLEAVPTDRKVELALDLERRTLAVDARLRGVFNAIYGDSAGERALASTAGIRVTDASTTSHVSVSAMVDDGDETHLGSGYSVGRHPDDLDLDEAAADAAERATAMLGARKPRSERLTVVLDPSVAAALLAVVGGTLNGESVLKGRSIFAERVGDEVAAACLVLVDDATDERSLGAGSHDGEGLASRRTTLIDGGVLQGFLHNTWSARRAATTSTASAVRGYSSTPAVGPRALAIVPGDLEPEALYAQVGHGFLVRSVSGLHSGVNPVSGDFSVGAAGLMIRDGAPAEPVREATIASTLQRMLLDIVAVGADLDWRPGGTGAASIAVADVSLSGT